MKTSLPRQSGIVLAVTLFMLALLTLIGVSAVTMSTSHLRLTGNLQTEMETEAALNRVMETFLSSSAPFTRPEGLCNPPPQTVTVNGHAITVDIDEPICTGIIEKTDVFVPHVFDIRAQAIDNLTHSSATIHWGVSIPLPMAPVGASAICKPVPSGNPC